LFIVFIVVVILRIKDIKAVRDIKVFKVGWTKAVPNLIKLKTACQNGRRLVIGDWILISG